MRTQEREAKEGPCWVESIYEIGNTHPKVVRGEVKAMFSTVRTSNLVVVWFGTAGKIKLPITSMLHSPCWSLRRMPHPCHKLRWHIDCRCRPLADVGPLRRRATDP